MDVLLKVDLNEFLTPKSCSLVVKQLIKYIAYNTQQIPYTYDGIAKQINCMKTSSDYLETAQQSMKIMKANRLYNEIKNQFNNFESTFKSIEEELLKNHENHGLKEIILVLGTTLLCPKLIFRIQIPPLSQQAKHCDISTRKSLCSLYRHLLKDYDKMFSKSIGPTNTFIFLRMEGKPSSDWFVPKHNFNISGRITSIVFSFNTPTPFECYTCETSVVKEEVVNEAQVVENSPTWYQAKETIKGFKDFNIEGVSVFSMIGKLSK
ncbi:uncharacterized protein LOC106666863 [Cimex lectularius]|uniref:MAD2L1-binding protein n=1 Tax=Cimex lectularius TaxID=79782 RepID=A0A8I6TEL4_CIMLE|nr:uncharacterized protein LOC106666863 [Cimex lectularius]